MLSKRAAFARSAARSGGSSRKAGKLFVISASSGTGKTTLARELLKEDKNLVQSISYTTRIPRSNERNGEDYYFVTRKEFEDMKRRRAFLEWANVFGRYYGTPKKEVEDHLKRGRNVLLLIDVQGAKKVKEGKPNAVFIFLSPPSKDELKRRLNKRGTESRREIAKRLKVATTEMKALNDMYNGRYLCDYRIVNRDIATASAILKAIIRAEHLEGSKRK